MDAARTIEETIAKLLTPRAFRKRARNGIRSTSAGESQVVNLQKSSWGGGNCYLNIGWDLLNRTPSVTDLVPLLTLKPWLALPPVRHELSRRGFVLPKHH